LNSDGSLDGGFNTGNGADGDVRSIVIQPNERSSLPDTFDIMGLAK
jgi:hypothetical protein